MRQFQFKYYVLNYDFNRKKVVQFNIFDNIHVQEWIEKAVKKYLENPDEYKCDYECFGLPNLYGFEALCQEIRNVLRWQMWGRREYEISVGDAFETDCNRLEKWNCYEQCHKNIRAIARECLAQYKGWLMAKKELEKGSKN